MFGQKMRFICVVENNGKEDNVNNCITHAINSARKVLRENGINTKDVGFNVCEELTNELAEKGFRPNSKSFYIVLEIDTIHNYMEIASIIKGWHRFYTFVAPTTTLKVGNGNAIAMNNNPYTTRNTITNEETNTPIMEFVDLGDVFEKMFSKVNQNNSSKEKNNETTNNQMNESDCLAALLFGGIPVFASSVDNFKNTIKRENLPEELRHILDGKKNNDNISKETNDVKKETGSQKQNPQMGQFVCGKTNDVKNKSTCPNFVPMDKPTREERTENFLIPKTEFEFLVSTLFRNKHKFDKEASGVILTIVEPQTKTRKIDLFMECDTFKVNGIMKKATEKNAKMMLTINFGNHVYDVYNDTLLKVSINETLNMIGICIEDVFGKTQNILLKK